MITFYNLKNGDKVRNYETGKVLEVRFDKQGRLYLRNEDNVWSASEFDPADWEIIK